MYSSFFYFIDHCFIRGSKHNDNDENFKTILTNCNDIIRTQTNVLQDITMTTDVDAFSFVIIADQINVDIHDAIQDLLLIFGTRLSGIKIPHLAIAAEKADSIFGSSRNQKGCQHLHSSVIGDILVSAETQVIVSPVKIAVHNSCRKGIVSFLNQYPQQYPMELSTNSDICFDPRSSANTPPYGVIIDALIRCCYVSQCQKYVFHLADIGTRHIVDSSNSSTCPLWLMFDKVKSLRKFAGVTVEMTQLDIAFNIPTKDVLVQWYCKPKRHENQKEKIRRKRRKLSTIFAGITPEVWALHVIKTESGMIKQDIEQEGTVRFKQDKWNISRQIIFPHHFFDKNSDESITSEYSPYSDSSQSTSLSTNSQSNSGLCNISTDAKSVYSIKCYSTISHILMQNRSEIPITFTKMHNLPKSSLESLKRFFDNMMGATMNSFEFIKKFGISARIEVSVRPSGRHPLGNSFRCHGHLLDALSHVHWAIKECFASVHYKMAYKTIPYELVYAKVSVLTEQVLTVTRLRGSLKFCDVFSGDKCALWLKAMVTLVLCTIGLAGQTKLKYLRKWIQDEDRFNPIMITPRNLTSLLCDTEHELPTLKEPPNIPDRTWERVHRHLKDLRFSEKCSEVVINVLKSNSPFYHSRKFYQQLSLTDKWQFAQNIRHHLIPILSSYMKKDDRIVSNSTNTTHHVNNMHPAPRGISFPAHILYSTDALHHFQDVPAKSNYKNKRIQFYIQDPNLLIITKLHELLMLFDMNTLIFMKYLYHYIHLCHVREIKLPRCEDNLSPLDLESPNLDFKHASRCIIGKKCDDPSLHIICMGLGIKILRHDDYSVRECMLASLCHFYLFPCEFKLDSSYLALLRKQEKQVINNLLCETIREDIVLELSSTFCGTRHYYRFHDDSHIWMPNQDFLLSKENYFHSDYSVIFQSQDLYIVLDKRFNNHGILGYEMRTNLHIFLQNISQHGCLCDKFLNDDGTNNKIFSQANSLTELQAYKKLAFVEQLNTNFQYLSNMCHEIILPTVALLYQSNIYLIDADSNISHLHRYDQNSSKVVTHLFPGVQHHMKLHLKCNLFMREGGVFKVIEEKQCNPRLQNNVHKLFFMENAQKYNSFNRHPQGRIRKAKSISESILKLFRSEEIKHEHFQKIKNDNDPLDILNYFTEFVLSYSGHHQLQTFFSTNIVSTLNTRGITTLETFLEELLGGYENLHHSLICPIICLKYKVWFSVWERTGNKNHSSKKTYFYGFDRRNTKVVCEEINDDYIHLPYQTHIFYIKYAESNQFGWWPQDIMNPFTYPEYTYCYSKNLTCPFSYLDDPLKMRIFDMFKKILHMRIFDLDHLSQNQALVHTCDRPLLVPLEFRNDRDTRYICHHGIMVIFPFSNVDRTTYACIIHGNVSLNIINDTRNHVLSHLSNDSNQPRFSVSALHFQSNIRFCSTFLVMVYMYITHSSSDITVLKEKMSKLQQESDVANKSKIWMSSMLSHQYTEQEFIHIPQWLHQIADTKESSFNIFS